MAPRKPIDPVWRIDLADESATEALAPVIAALVRAGSLITLSGDLGAGKTTFARALIRHITGEPELDVPSPTYTLMQVYGEGPYPIVHADLYRIRDPRELTELGWEEAGEGALVLVEWADRAGDALPADRLDIAFTLDAARGDQRRIVTLTGHGAFAESVGRERAIAQLLTQAGWREARRTFMLGDASTRAYERLVQPNGETAILMISPARPDGPPVRYGKPYSAIARLAEDIRPFIAVDEALRAEGYSAPRIHAHDLDSGLAILEDLGSDGVVDANGPIPERYAESVALLASLHARPHPDQLPIVEGETHRIPPYDQDAMLIEVELLVDWYAPHVARANLSSSARAVFVNLWRDALQEVLKAPQTWTLRDYHSPNLLWLPNRQGVQRVGVIDFQDCVLGHPAYDVASLLQDARVTVPDDLELRLLGHYARLRKEAEPEFDMAPFARAYAILGAQRATKILGIFARLDKRDFKPHYLAHLPRIESYLVKDLRHPALADIRAWFENYMPSALGLGPKAG